MLSAKPTSAGERFAAKPKQNRFLIEKIKGLVSWILGILGSRLFFYTRTRVGVVFMLVLLSMTFATGALAESGTSPSYRLDYSRFTNDSDRKVSTNYTLIDSISDISVEGASSSYNLRNVYSAGIGGAPVCGNGIIETGEQCEGVNFSGLACSNYGFTQGILQCVSCQIATTSCFNGGGGGGGGGFICGNGIREAGEQCDDNNLFSGDGCSAGCRLEDHRCGNGIKEIGEQCDDGNVDFEDGCTPMCTLETPVVLPPEPEPPLIFEPGFDPKLVFDFPIPESEPEPEIKPETPVPLRPVAPTEPVIPDEIDYGILSAYDYHFDNYGPGTKVTVLDETPFVATEAEPNAIYEMIIFDENYDVVTRQGVQSTPKGILMFEGIPFLEYKNYGIALFDENRELFKSWTINIENRKYRQHDNLYVNDELNREYIALGSFEEANQFSGNGKSNATYHAYVQRIEKQGRKISEITHISTKANKDGDYKLELPEKLKDGSYLMHVVQVYEDGKVQRNKRYIFDIHSADSQRSIWILLAILVVFLLGQLQKTNGKKGGRKRKSTLRSFLSIAIMLSVFTQQSTAFAAITTPAVFIYEGKLLNAASVPITTAQTFRFSLWSSDDFLGTDILGSGAIDVTAPAYGGWQEAQTLTPNTDGTFFVELGSVMPIPNMLFTTHKNLMVEIKTSGALDTTYELMDPTGDAGVDTDDRQTIGSTPYTNNADYIDNAEVGTTAGDIATLGIGDIWDIAFMPDATNADTWTIDDNDTVGAGGHIELIFGDTLAETLSFDITNSWFEFSDDVSFNQNEIKDVAIDNLAAAPGAPVAGQIYHNTTDGNTYIWNSVAWEDITNTGDLDTAYDNDTDKKLNVDNATGLELESSVAGDIVVDLQSTGDFVIQDAGTPFAIFTDGGYMGVGNTSPLSVFHIDSNAANTAAIATFENTAGDIQFFRNDATPEGSVTGSIGDFTIDGTNGNAYIKNFGTATNTGWLQIGGLEAKTAVFHAEYEDTTIQGDGTANKGLLSSYFADAGGTSKYNYYEWTTRNAAIQDVDITISFRLPEDFQSFTATPLSILYRTSDGVLATNQIDVILYDTTGTAVSLTGGTDLASATWATAGITFGGSPTFTAGDVVTLVVKPQTTSAGYARVSDVIFNYNGT